MCQSLTSRGLSTIGHRAVNDKQTLEKQEAAKISTRNIQTQAQLLWEALVKTAIGNPHVQILKDLRNLQEPQTKDPRSFAKLYPKDTSAKPCIIARTGNETQAIRRPANVPFQPTYSRPMPTFAAAQPLYSMQRPKLAYTEPDPYAFVSADKANESIKALLEGVFEDEDDKGLRNMDDLADQMAGISVEDQMPGLRVRLLPHQVDGVDWMQEKEKTRPKGGILADDMGLGKTIQAIALILARPHLPGAGGTLIVAPLALIKQWEAELMDKVAESHRLRVCVHHGPQRNSGSLDKFDVVITTYQILVSEHASQAGCFGSAWHRIILDEAHTIKNRNAKATKAANALEADYRWCLTGTPMQNGLDELQSLIAFLRIKPYAELGVWRDQITRPMNTGRGAVALKRLQYYLKAFMKRRTKDVLKLQGSFQIKARTVTTVEVELSAAERQSYDQLEQRTGQTLDQLIHGEKINYASALVLLLRLRQACNHPALVGKVHQETWRDEVEVDDIADLLGGLHVEEAVSDSSAKIRYLLTILRQESPEHKVIVFSEFTTMLDAIEPHLQSAKLIYTRYDGSMRNDAREAALEQLRNDNECRILLCSLKCGSLGLNLVAASRVVILEPFWNPFVEEQAIDRVHRLNQTQDVLVFKFTVLNTVEARILQLQEKKRALANAAIEGKEKLAKLSKEDILGLFGRGADSGTSKDWANNGIVLAQQDHSGKVPLQARGRGMEPKSDEKQSYVKTTHDVTKLRLSDTSGKESRPKEDALYGRRW